MAKIGILGAGFGGLEAANILIKDLKLPHEIYLFDKRREFYMGLSKLWVLVGKKSKDEIVHDLSGLKKKGIFLVHEEIVKICAE